MRSTYSVDDLILNYDPEHPPERFREAGLEAAMKSSTGRLPGPVPWPRGHAPTAAPLAQSPAESDDLGRFRGYDTVVVTWTAAEAAALAALFMPDFLPSRWYEYRHDVADYVPLVTGGRAPFNARAADMARYFHSMGLYMPCTIGGARVLLFTSGLHPAYDGPATPLRKLMIEIAKTVQPKVMITTGTGGAIGADVLPGDVVIAAQTRFDCTKQFKNQPWAQASYKTSALPAGALGAITPELTRVNASRIPNTRPEPKIWTGDQQATVVTTDFFAFDDWTDFYKLQGLGQACDMGDAMVGHAMQDCPGVDWYAVRNASDPQIPNPQGDIEAANHQAGRIYAEWGAFTTAASAIATWAIIDARFNRR